MQKIGDEIKSKRKQLGLTQHEVVGEFMSISKLSNIENGKILPDIETWNYLKQKLELSDSLLMNHEAMEEVEFSLEQAATYSRTGLMKKAKEKYLEIVNRPDAEIFFKEQAAYAYKELALTHLHEKKLSEALRSLEKAKTLFEAAADYVNLGKCLVNEGTILFKQEKYEEAITVYRDSLKNLPEEETSLKGAIYYNMASIYFWLNKLDNANYYCEKAVTFLNENDTSHYPGALILQGILHKEARMYLLAKEKLKKAKELSIKHNKSYLIGKCWHNLGIIEMEVGMNEKALEYFEMSLEIKKTQLDEVGMIRTQVSIAELYYKTGQLDKAKELADISLLNCRKQGLRLEEILCLKVLSRVYSDNYQEELFLDTIFKAMTLVDRLGLTSKKVEFLEIIAQFFYQKGDYNTCRDKLFEAFLIKKRVTENDLEVTTS